MKIEKDEWCNECLKPTTHYNDICENDSEISEKILPSLFEDHCESFHGSSAEEYYFRYLSEDGLKAVLADLKTIKPVTV